MGIFRGPGGTGDATTDAVADQVGVDSATASTKASEAAASATAAATSAASASTSASTATTQATNATNSASSASSSATAAAISRTSASSDATLAGISASSAVSAKIAAESAKTAAETAKTNAETAETNAATSETNASNSASSASTSASNASTSASNASTSASNAATSATSAQSALTSINAFYLGTATSNPTVDGNGNAVTAGDWYFNTSDNTTRIYTGSTWNTISPDLTGDSSPQLGGNLDLNNNDITGTGNLNITGNIALSGTVDGRDVAADGTKLDGVESGATADQTAAEIRTLVESATDSNVFTDADHTKLNGIEASADVTDAANVTAAGALMDSEVTNLAQVKAFDSSDYATAAQGTTADSALQNVVEDTTPQLGGNLDLNSNDLTGTGNINITGTLQTSSNAIIGGNLTVSGTTTTVNTETINLADNNIVLNSNHTGAPSQNAGITVERGNETDKVFQWNETTDLWETDDNFKVNGNITVTGTVDGRDLQTDGTKLDNIEASADVTDTANVTAAGALMDSEVTNLAQVKAFDSSDYATAAQGSTADSALQNVVEDTTPQLGGNLASNGSDVVFADNDKAIFGAGSDLQIYHDGSASFINDSGTGNLKIQGTHLQLQNAAGTQSYLAGVDGGATSIHYAGVTKLATTSTGIDVTGTVTADGLTVDGNGTIQSNASSSVPTLTLKDTDTTVSVGQSLGRLSFSSADNSPDAAGERAYIKGLLEGGGTAYGLELGAMVSGSSPVKRLSVSGSGDISFYEDTGTTAKFFWDSSAESLGIGTSSPARELEVTGSGNVYVKITAPTATDSAGLELANTGATWLIQNDDTSNEALTFDRAGTEVMRIDDSGNVGIGTDTPANKLHVKTDTDGEGITIQRNSTTEGTFGELGFSATTNDAGDANLWIRGYRGSSFGASYMTLGTNNLERVRLDSSGNLLVGTTETDIGYTDSGAGVSATPTGYVQVARSSANELLYLNKLDNDGDVIRFSKDGTEFGAISLSSSNNLSISGTVADHSGVLFGTHVIFPTEAGTLANGTISLGSSSAKFKDLVLSGTVDGGNGSAAAPTFTFSSDTNTGMFRAAADTLGFSTAGAEDMRLTSGGDLHVDGNVIAYSTTISDRRLKSDITNISNALDKVGQINGVTFVRDHNGEKAAGVVAQEIMEVLPEAVKSQALPLQTGDDKSEYYVVEYDAVTGLLVEAVKELKTRVEALESR